MVTRYRARTDDLLWRDMDRELIILDLSGSTYFTLNDTGAYLWERLVSGGATEGELVDAVVAEFAVERGAAARDAAEFLHNLESRGLLASAE
jgi:Coenzyme PQQ synthesis protein D (PqqD)